MLYLSSKKLSSPRPYYMPLEADKPLVCDKKCSAITIERLYTCKVVILLGMEVPEKTALPIYRFTKI